MPSPTPIAVPRRERPTAGDRGPELTGLRNVVLGRVGGATRRRFRRFRRGRPTAVDELRFLLQPGVYVSEVDDAMPATWPHPLGRSTPRHWGDGSWIWTGLDVINGLVQAIQDLVEGRWKPRGWHHRPVVLACTPWLTDPDVVSALIRTDCCVVIAKESRVAWGHVARLQDEGSGVPKLMLRRLDYYAGPGDYGTPREAYGHDDPNPAHDVQLGPVRVTGWRRVGREGGRFPLMHAKVAVFGYYEMRRLDADGYGTYESADFRPVAAWTGSANFTIRSRVSAEIGILTTDDDLVDELYDFVIDAIRVSEPLNDTGPDDPSPELVVADSYEPTSADLEYMRERQAEDMEENYGPDWER